MISVYPKTAGFTDKENIKPLRVCLSVVVLGFNVPLTAKIKQRSDIGFKEI